MKSTQDSAAPRLQPPGAGVPLPVLLVLKLWYGAVVSKRAKREDCRKTYETLVQKLIATVEKVPADLRNHKILIDPIAGIEDSSRYWSLHEVLEHLMIVGHGVERIILSLASGVVPQGEASTAAVKPGKAQGNQLEAFIAWAPGLIASLDQKLAQPGMSFDWPLRYRHPWFGPITLRQWYWLLGTHQGLHYRQAKQIAQKLLA
jgi:hypothetical protein